MLQFHICSVWRYIVQESQRVDDECAWIHEMSIVRMSAFAMATQLSSQFTFNIIKRNLDYETERIMKISWNRWRVKFERTYFIGAIDIIKCQLNISSMCKNQFTSGHPTTWAVKCTIKMPSVKWTLRSGAPKICSRWI